MGYKLCKFYENRARDTPLWGVYIPHFGQISVKIKVFGVLHPCRCTVGVKFGVEEGTLGPLLHANHPRCRSGRWICMCGRSPTLLYIPSFIEIRSGILEPLGVEICPFPLLWVLAFTTACATVQALIIFVYHLCER